MIDKLNLHYSFNNPASAFDEEALTSLELAGRQGAKINELIDDQNALKTETAERIKAQDETIESRMNAQDNAISSKVNSAIQSNITSGTFNASIDRYAGEVISRVNLIEGQIPVGPTSMDAEVLDIRVGAGGKTYANAGESVREQIKTVVNDFDFLINGVNGLIELDGNLVNHKTLTSGYYLDGNGNPSVLNNFSYTDYIPVKPNTRYSKSYVGWNVWMYDRYKNIIDDVVDQQFTTSENCCYIRTSIQNNLINNFAIVEGDIIPSGRELYSVNLKYQNGGSKVIKMKADGTGDFATMKDLMNYCLNNFKSQNIKVVFGSGTFDVFSGFTEDDINASTFFGLRLANVEIEGAGANKTFLVGDLSDYSASTCERVSCINLESKCSLRNLTVKGKNVRYPIHSDFMDPTGTYEETNIIHIENVNAYTLSGEKGLYASLGAGYVGGSNIVVNNCHFTSEKGYAMTYHNTTLATDEPSLLQFNNCIFINTNVDGKSVKIQGVGATAKDNIYFNGCVIKNGIDAVAENGATVVPQNIYLCNTSTNYEKIN